MKNSAFRQTYGAGERMLVVLRAPQPNYVDTQIGAAGLIDDKFLVFWQIFGKGALESTIYTQKLQPLQDVRRGYIKNQCFEGDCHS